MSSSSSSRVVGTTCWQARCGNAVTTTTTNRYATTATAGAESQVAIHWFRNGLRLHDNPSLKDACERAKQLLNLVIIDPQEPFAQTAGCRAGCVRANFVLEALHNLDQGIQSLGSGDKDKDKDKKNRLVVILGDPRVVLPEVVVQLQATALYVEREVAAPCRAADGHVLEAVQTRLQGSTQQCRVCAYDTLTLHPVERYVASSPQQVAPPTYQGFLKVFSKLGRVPTPVEDVTTMPPLPDNMEALYETFREAGSQSNDDETFLLGIPTLEQLGYTHVEAQLEHRAKGGIDFVGGETAALSLLEKQMKRTSWVCTFEKPNTSPNALTVDTTGLSPYVKHGCLSPRRFYHELSRVYSQFRPEKLSKPPVSLHGQLLWREFNYLTGYTTPNFDKMVGNPVARQIPWGDDAALQQAWRNGQTGYPFIDAIMTQLRQTGWIHHLARHAVACFLTRGDLWQSWEYGARVFEEELIDADWSINNFNWQWLSCTAHFYQYFRCYSPIAFGKKTDKEGNYIRKWLPQFKTFPARYIYEPWMAPIAVQQSHGVVVGENYPHRLVEHAEVSKRNMTKMKAAYDRQNGQLAQQNDDDDNERTNASRAPARPADSATSRSRRRKSQTRLNFDENNDSGRSKKSRGSKTSETTQA